MLLAALLTFAPAVAAAADCDAAGALPAAEVAPELLKLAGAPALLKGALVRRGAESTDVDERVQPLTIVLKQRAVSVRVPLALPRGARGLLELSGELPSSCIEGRMITSGDDTVRVQLVLPVTARLGVKRKGHPEKRVELKLETISLHASHLALTSTVGTEQAVYVGDKLPDAESLQREARSSGDRGGARAFLGALALIDTALPEDVRADPSPAAQAVMFLSVAEGLRTSISSIPPAQRLEIGAAIQVGRLPPALRPLAQYWHDALVARPAGKDANDARARLLIDDDIAAVFIDGVAVFDRATGASTSVEVKAPKEALRVWIVPRSSSTTQVFDTNAIVLPGQIYNVGAQRFAPVSGGARRECIRVGGTLPAASSAHSGGSPFRWRELGAPPGPLLQHDEAFRPSGAQDRREVGVTEMDMTAARVPPLPLVYSYTHPGTYEWTVKADGSVKLRLLPGEKLCSVADGDVSAP